MEIAYVRTRFGLAGEYEEHSKKFQKKKKCHILRHITITILFSFGKALKFSIGINAFLISLLLQIWNTYNRTYVFQNLAFKKQFYSLYSSTFQQFTLLVEFSKKCRYILIVIFECLEHCD